MLLTMWMIGLGHISNWIYIIIIYNYNIIYSKTIKRALAQQKLAVKIEHIHMVCFIMFSVFDCNLVVWYLQ